MKSLLLVGLLIFMNGCTMYAILEEEETVCYTLEALDTQNENNCIQNGNSSIEAQVFEHPIPDYAVDGMWAAQRELLDQSVDVTYQLHVHESELLDGFVTFYFDDCRLTFDVVPCSASN